MDNLAKGLCPLLSDTCITTFFMVCANITQFLISRGQFHKSFNTRIFMPAKKRKTVLAFQTHLNRQKLAASHVRLTNPEAVILSTSLLQHVLFPTLKTHRCLLVVSDPLWSILSFSP